MVPYNLHSSFHDHLFFENYLSGSSRSNRMEMKNNLPFLINSLPLFLLKFIWNWSCLIFWSEQHIVTSLFCLRSRFWKTNFYERALRKGTKHSIILLSFFEARPGRAHPLRKFSKPQTRKLQELPGIGCLLINLCFWAFWISSVLFFPNLFLTAKEQTDEEPT